MYKLGIILENVAFHQKDSKRYIAHSQSADTNQQISLSVLPINMQIIFPNKLLKHLSKRKNKTI
jgi:hypothetical protein